jgi:hypothetical protein
VTRTPVKIFGERNTGTHAIAEIIERNSKSRCLPGVEAQLSPFISNIVNHRFFPKGRVQETINDRIFEAQPPLNSWKHRATNFDDASAFQEVFVLFTVRHPASWLLALFNRPYHRLGPSAGDLKTFIDQPWKTVGREGLGGKSYRPLDLCKAKLDSYRAFAAKLEACGIPHEFVRFEDLILGQAAVFGRISSHLSDPTTKFTELRTSTKDSNKTLDDYRRYYGEELWRSSFQGLEERINAQLDQGSLSEFGYEKL